MYLKRLEITGFKSFAARSVLDFENGEKNVTAVVGPNGSGKSNIADAIRWVLGEQSYKTIRSKKSEDVIFSGSDGKSRGSMAKVSMVLDNSDGKAPIDFTEVQISRSIFRDGSSEYLIAGKKARLLDVAELLAKSGFGQSTYSVIGQGMVDSMLFYGPAERKVLFDEAAGVRAYELKREQALKKLEDTNGNIIRIKDILSELNPRLSTLKRQAEKAKEKDNIKADLTAKQKTYFASIWDRFNHQESEKRDELEKLLAEESKIQSEIEGLNKSFEEVLKEEKKSTADTEEIQKKIRKLEDQKDEIRQQIYTIRAKMELSASALTKKEIDEKIAALNKELAALGLAEKLAQKENLASDLLAQKPEELKQKLAELEDQKDEVRQQIYTLKAQAEVASSGLTKDQIAEKVDGLKSELKSLNEHEIVKKIESLEKEIASSEKEITDLDKKILEKKEKVAALTHEISKFDFGTVSEKVSAILYLQNDFIIKIESAKDMKEVAEAVSAGKNVADRLKELRRQAGDATEGKISGMAELQEELEALLVKKESAQRVVSEKKSEVWKLDFEHKKVGDRRFEIEKEMGKLSALAPSDQSQKKEIEAQVESLKSQIAKIDNEIDELKKKQESLSSLRSQISNLQYEIRHAENQKTQIEREIKRLSDLKPADEGEKKNLESQIEELKKKVAELDVDLDRERTAIGQKTSGFSTQSKQLTEIKDSLTTKQGLVSEYAREITELRVELGKIETKKQDLRDEIAREMGSEAALADAKVVPELDEVTIRTEIDKLKNKLYAIGEIDPEVETEFTEVGQRVEFMSTQIEDLEKAKTDMEKLISDLDNRIKKQFEGSFEAISQKFKHFFEILFGGGKASLELVKSKDEDGEQEQFGIEITAVPPGKRVQSLSALSGGERTLTSLALLFAILSVNPAPFCVLDEVDAALDETNTKKFLKIVDELSAKTQFIFISHNRETMKTANLIYGVTMDDSHASKLLSIRLSEALDTVDKKQALAL